MSAFVAKKHVQREKVSHQKESATETLQRELNELKNRVRRYHEDLDNVEEMCEETKEDIKRVKTKAEQQCKIVKTESAKEARIIAKLTEMNKELERLKKQNATSLKAEPLPCARKNVAKYTSAYQVMRFVKIGCVLVLDSVTAYTLYYFTKPLFFL